MTPTTKNSEALFAKSQMLFPGGVNSPVRAFRHVGGTPRFINRGQGAYLFDEDGNKLIDYVLAWGPLVAGHAHPVVISAIAETAARGTVFGAPSALENELAELIQLHMPSLEKMRFTSSGTEATMSAIRVARTYTKRPKIIKFSGCYHGHAEHANILEVPYNNLGTVQQIFDEHPTSIAAVIIEPIAGNMGLIKPLPNFLPGLKALCQKHNTILIFDEVMTGFRAHIGGAQALYDVKPDLTCLGKIMGGGLPAAAYGGRKEIMDMVAPMGPMYQAGTMSGNPLAMASGIATLKLLAHDKHMALSETLAEKLTLGIDALAKRSGIPMQVDHVGNMFGLAFLKEPKQNPIINYETAEQYVDKERYARFFHHMLANGVYLAPSAMEAGFTSFVHMSEDIELTLSHVDSFFRSLAPA